MKAVNNDEFLEWTEFSDNYYGTNKTFVQKCLDNNERLILEIDVKGAINVKEKIKNSVLIFILPPSFEELERRLRGRKTETEESIRKRLSIVKSEIQKSKLFDYTVTNNTVEKSVEEIEQIIKDEQI